MPRKTHSSKEVLFVLLGLSAEERRRVDIALGHVSSVYGGRVHNLVITLGDLKKSVQRDPEVSGDHSCCCDWQ